MRNAKSGDSFIAFLSSTSTGSVAQSRSNPLSAGRLWVQIPSEPPISGMIARVAQLQSPVILTPRMKVGFLPRVQFFQDVLSKADGLAWNEEVGSATLPVLTIPCSCSSIIRARRFERRRCM